MVRAAVLRGNYIPRRRYRGVPVRTEAAELMPAVTIFCFVEECRLPTVPVNTLLRMVLPTSDLSSSLAEAQGRDAVARQVSVAFGGGVT